MSSLSTVNPPRGPDPSISMMRRKDGGGSAVSMYEAADEVDHSGFVEVRIRMEYGIGTVFQLVVTKRYK